MLLKRKLFWLCHWKWQGRMRNFLSIFDNIYYLLETKFLWSLISHSVVFTKQILNLMSDSAGFQEWYRFWTGAALPPRICSLFGVSSGPRRQLSTKEL